MAKYIVKCYYEYVATVEVEADSYDEAYEKGFDMCDAMPTEALEYVGTLETEVFDEQYDMETFNN